MKVTTRMQMLGAISIAGCLLVAACASESGGDASDPAGSLAPGGTTAPEALVLNAVAPYDFESSRDHGYVQTLFFIRTHEAIADCVVRRGGVTSSPPPIPDRSAPPVEEAIGDFPNLELLAEQGRSILITERDPSIRREDFDTDLEFFDAQMSSGPDVIRATPDVIRATEDEQELGADCMAEPAFEERVGAMNDLFTDLSATWFGILRDIDSSPEVHALREAFRECAVEGGMQAEPRAGSVLPPLNEIVFWSYADGEGMGGDDIEQQRSHMRERGKLFARCGEEIYTLKERLRREAHDRFVEEHAVDIATVSDYLYGEGLLDTSETDAR